MTSTHDRRGWLTRAVQALFGEPDTNAQAQHDAKRALKRATSHGAAMLAFARLWSIPLMIFFSIGALVTLGWTPLQHNIALYLAGQPLDYVELAGLAVTVVFVIGMDVAMIVAAVMLRNAQNRQARFGETWHLWFVMVSVGALEAATFITMVEGYEHPQTVAAWALLVGRGVMAPIIAIFLSLAGEQPVSHRDVRHLLQVRSGEGLLSMLESTLSGDGGREADMAQLFSFFTLVNGDVGTTQAEQDAWYGNVMATMERMVPASARALAQREIEQTQFQAAQDVAQARAEAQRQIETAQRQVEAATTAATQRTLDAILSLVATGALPDWLIEQRPDLAGFSLAQLAGGANGGNGRGRNGKGGVGGLSSLPAREPASQAERVRRWLAEQGIEPCRAPEGKRGVWLRVADVETLTAGHASASETHQSLVKRLGGSQVVGRALVAPFEPVMRELYERHLLTDEARVWWVAQSQSGDDTADDGHADARSNVVAMRA